MSEQRLNDATRHRQLAQNELAKANIELQWACIELSQAGYSGYRIAQIAGVSKMSVYTWLRDKTS